MLFFCPNVIVPSRMLSLFFSCFLCRWGMPGCRKLRVRHAMAFAGTLSPGQVHRRLGCGRPVGCMNDIVLRHLRSNKTTLVDPSRVDILSGGN